MSHKTPQAFCQASGKISYPDRGAASRVRQAKRKRRGGGETFAYRCRECGAFHLAHGRYNERARS